MITVFIYYVQHTIRKLCLLSYVQSSSLFMYMYPSSLRHDSLKDGMNALHLAICGNHADVVKVLIDEFNVAMMPKGPVSSQSFKHKLSHE